MTFFNQRPSPLAGAIVCPVLLQIHPQKRKKYVDIHSCDNIFFAKIQSQFDSLYLTRS